MYNLKVCKSVHIIIIQVDLTSNLKLHSLLFHVLMNTLLCAHVKKDEKHTFRATAKQSHMSTYKILAVQLQVFYAP
jgi:hypothetical protein